MTNSARPRVALVGGGIGGLSAALALLHHGFEAHVFEQASGLREIGAGLELSSNARNVMNALGLEGEVNRLGCECDAKVRRDWISGQTLLRTPLKGVVDARFGSTSVQIHRRDLLEMLAAKIPASLVHLNRKCVSVQSSTHGAMVEFDSGERAVFDLVVGCDGIHSQVRGDLFGRAGARFTGHMCWRALVPASQLPENHVSRDLTFWMGPGGHVVTFYLREHSLVNVVAVKETLYWLDESWSIEAPPGELVAAFPDVHRDLRILLDKAGDCIKWGLFDRDPLPVWSAGFATLLGDAAHPMLPFLGQGAAMAIEDAWVLARELARTPSDIAEALRSYEQERIPRTARMQLAARRQANIFHGPHAKDSRENVGHRPSEGPSTDWVYEYDPTRRRI